MRKETECEQKRWMRHETEQERINKKRTRKEHKTNKITSGHQNSTTLQSEKLHADNSLYQK